MVTLQDIKERHSVRNFADMPMTPEQIRTLKAEITLINTHNAGLDFTLVTDDGTPFNGLSKSYGSFKGVRNYIVVVGDPSYQDVHERAGYYGEQLVMQAIQMGLDTCFVSGTYSAKDVNINLRAGQKILFLIAVGIGAVKKQTKMSAVSVMLSHLKKMTPRDFYVETPNWPYEKAVEAFPYLEAGLEAIACAPSAYNKRPVRIKVAQLPNDERFGARNVALTAFVETVTELTLIDLGIAKYNFGAVAPGLWDWGNAAPFLPE